MANQEIEIVLCEPDMSWLVEGWNDMVQTRDPLIDVENPDEGDVTSDTDVDMDNSPGKRNVKEEDDMEGMYYLYCVYTLSGAS